MTSASSCCDQHTTWKRPELNDLQRAAENRLLNMVTSLTDRLGIHPHVSPVRRIAGGEPTCRYTTVGHTAAIFARTRQECDALADLLFAEGWTAILHESGVVEATLPA